MFFHGYANFEKGVNKQFLKLTSCNTTGLIRAVDCLDRAYGMERVAITIVRRVADPGDYHRGLTNALRIDKAPSHQAVDLMTIMPHVAATGILIHTPVTHGHIITVVAHGKEKITKEMALKAFHAHPRIRVVSARGNPLTSHAPSLAQCCLGLSLPDCGAMAFRLRRVAETLRCPPLTAR